MSKTRSVADRVVLVTRPQHQSAELIQLIEQAGATALAMPSIEIQAIAIDEPLEKQLRSINRYDQVIFISANAVHYAVGLLQSLEIQPASIHTAVAVIGKATREAAEKAGISVRIQAAQGFNSAALLALPELQQLKDKRILLIRGEGGLEVLADELSRRGANVDYAEVYRRCIPVFDSGLNRQQLSQQWSQYAPTDILVSSNESLQNLYDMLEPPGQQEMLKARLIVPSQRCLELGHRLGFECIKQAQSALNEHMLGALLN